ncbi:MAG: hypothetical protein R2824_27520 [Saprospiraceae bacterium]|nr:hypothetical protein [Lewinella sp.]
MPNQNFELRSEEVQEVLRRVPPVVSSWGPMALLLVIVLLSITAYFIKIPDRISGNFHLQSDQIGRLYIDNEKTGLIRPGQTVLIELDNYPSSQFGLLEATVGKLRYDEQEAVYIVETAPLRILHTSYDQELAPLPSLSGHGIIILEEERLLFRFLPFLSTINS